MLNEKLAEMKAASAAKIPADVMTVIQSSNQVVADTIPARKIPGVGDKLPAFTLPDSKGTEHNSGDLIGDGHLVVTFFRGSW